MRETADIQVKVIKIDLMILSTLIVASLVFYENPMNWIRGFAFGGLIGILNFMQLARTMEKAVRMNPGRAQGYASVNYFIRFATMGLVILVSLKADYINAMASIIGLLMIKFIIIFTNLFNDKEYYKNIFKRKEEE